MDFQPPDDQTHDYGVQLMTTVGSVESAKYPAQPDPTPDPGDLPFALPTLSNPLNLTVPMDTDFRLPTSSAGRDVVLDFEGRQGKIRQYSLILDSSAGPPNTLWMQNIHTKCTKPHDVGGSGYRNGGLKVQTKAKKGVITDIWDEKDFAIDPTGCDGIGIASAGFTDWWITRFRLEGAVSSSTPSGQHIDCIQLQGPINSMRIGFGSCELSGVKPGNDPGKGLQLAEEPWNESEQDFTVYIDKVDFLCKGRSDSKYGVVFVQEYARDKIILGNDVYWILPEAVKVACGDNFQVTGYTNGRPGDYGVVSGSRPNRVLDWASKPGAGVTGKIKEKSENGFVPYVTPATLGY